MKTISIRDLRQKWPVVERGLKTSGGMLITRGSIPVARLLPLEDSGETERERFDPEEHTKWMKQTWGASTPTPWVDDALAADRGDD
jgi:antitoxin (DNA-binding transcriptional repressor) of toxin-antitoxin stability system